MKHYRTVTVEPIAAHRHARSVRAAERRRTTPIATLAELVRGALPSVPDETQTEAHWRAVWAE